MALIDLLFGKSKAQFSAEQSLVEAEDRLMGYDEHESVDLGVHAKKDADRVRVFLARQRNFEVLFLDRSDRNFRMTVVLGCALLLKGVITVSDLAAMAHRLFGF